jgi:epoxyqueuosine reductase
MDPARSAEIITQAESFPGIQAGIAHMDNILKGPSYRTISEGQGNTAYLHDIQVVDWPKKTCSVLVLGLKHPKNDPRLDWWERGDSWGNRRLREISGLLKKWLLKEHGLGSQPLPYHVEKGGLFLKDAAVMAGLGIIGQNNLLLHPEWGARIRLRSILIEADLQPTEGIEGFSHCETCDYICQKACPMNAFPNRNYSRQICSRQMNADEENTVPDGEINENGEPNLVIKYCRVCELSCPVGL